VASVSASHLIFFIASVIVAASVAGTFTTGVNDVSQSLQSHSVDVAKQVRTNVAIISDAGANVYNRSGKQNVTLLVKNTGEQPIPVDPTEIDVMLDGTYEEHVPPGVLGRNANGTWLPGDVVRVTFSAPGLAAGDHRVKLVVNGDSEVFRFRV